MTTIAEILAWFREQQELEAPPPFFTPDPNACTHSRCPRPAYDSARAALMSVAEIKRIYPRTEEKCPDCGTRVIMYASADHYIMGDW